MLSQIQPHFLYYALSIIQALCETDSATASVAKNDFGYDAVQIADDGRKHVGICYVRSRLSDMCAATLEVTSTPGIVSKAVITIPKFIGEDAV